MIVSSSAGEPTANEGREGAASRMPASRPVTLQLTRDGAPMTLTMLPDQVCDYPLKVTNGGEVNAYADGKMIYISRGMMRFAAEDRELAMVVGHELGHNTMGHVDKKKTNAAIGAVFDILAAAYRVNTQSAFMNAGASAYSQDFESEADYVGMYYMARAGYETVGAADFWRRMAAEHPGSIKANHAASHPATAERFLALDKVGGEVRAKMASGVALAPNRVGGPTTGQPPAQTVQAAGAPQGSAVPPSVPGPVAITATPAPSRVVQVPAPATASPSPPPAPVGQDSYVAERLARESSCSANPTASLVAKGAGFESSSMRCASGDALMIRCEFGNCRVLK